MTPMMQQYMNLKEEHNDCLMLFRLGDFYELFYEDAEIASRELEITLTARGGEDKVPMCGVPHHAASSYIDKLVSKGYKVAICEQIENPAEAKGIVKRDVVRIITPGTLIDTNLLEDKKNNYLASLYISSKGYGLTYIDISTGEFSCTQVLDQNKLIDEITKIMPNEIIYYCEEDSYSEEQGNIIGSIIKVINVYTYKCDPWIFEKTYSSNQIKEHFNIMALEGLGFNNEHLGIQSTGGLLHYLKTTQKRVLSHINKVNIYDLSEKMTLDISTRRNLELTETIRGKNKKGSLLWILDKTLTAMGGRMIRRWIEEPLLDYNCINERLNAVEILKDDILLRKELGEYLKQIYDLERLAGKIAFGSANPRDLIALKRSISFLPTIKELFNQEFSNENFTDLGHKSLLGKILSNIDPLEDVENIIENSILEEPSLTLKEGGIIKEGYNHELDDLQKISKEGKLWIAEMELGEKNKTNIKSLKIGYNKVFGYYIEVSKTNVHLVPDTYIRKQTLANCERYITPELKEIESKVLGAEDKIINIEYELFIEVRNMLLSQIKRIQVTANAIAELDVLYSFAEVAEENDYTKPIVNNSEVIHIEEGRHPVVERVLKNEIFVPNDVFMDTKDEQLLLVTGPNMAGKSTYMRQVALIVLMAQIGSFVPAESASIGIVDRIFTRVGANDDLAQGQSTFMVEMSEMANIINTASKKSLLVIDEIGRGTSTFDGLSIAWSVAEYICNFINARTLFSTHYHELTKLSETYKGIVNYKVSVTEDGHDIIFLHKVLEGSADRSYGIQVARLAGLPLDIINRASTILGTLESEGDVGQKFEFNNMVQEAEIALTIKGNTNKGIEQLNFDNLLDMEIINELKDINLMETTPMDAINILYNLHKKANQV